MSNSNPILIRKYGDNITECHLSVMSQQTTTATNRASVMHAVIHAWYMSGLISRSDHIAVSGLWTRNTAIYWSYTVYLFLFATKRLTSYTFTLFGSKAKVNSIKLTLFIRRKIYTKSKSFSSFLPCFSTCSDM